MKTILAVLKVSPSKFKQLWLVFGHCVEKFGVLLFQHLVTRLQKRAALRSNSENPHAFSFTFLLLLLLQMFFINLKQKRPQLVQLKFDRHNSTRSSQNVLENKHMVDNIQITASGKKEYSKTLLNVQAISNIDRWNTTRLVPKMLNKVPSELLSVLLSVATSVTR